MLEAMYILVVIMRVLQHVKVYNVLIFAQCTIVRSVSVAMER